MQTGIDPNAVVIVTIVSPAALLYYEYILTFNIEVTRFWSPLQCNWGTVVFLFNRYTAIFGHIAIVAELFIVYIKEKECNALATYHRYLSIIIQVIAGIVMVLRVYALWERNRVILAIMLVSGVTFMAIAVWIVSSSPHTKLPAVLPSDSGITKCHYAALPSTDGDWRSAVAWSGVFLFDAMIFGLTMYKTLQIGRTSRQTMVDILLRDGSMYFGVIGTGNLVNVLLLFLGGPLTHGVLATYINVLASVCSARLMLNIRDPKVQWLSQHTTLDTPGPFLSTIVDRGPTVMDERLNKNDIELLAQN